MDGSVADPRSTMMEFDMDNEDFFPITPTIYLCLKLLDIILVHNFQALVV